MSNAADRQEAAPPTPELSGLTIDLSNPDELRDYLVASLEESGAVFEHWPLRLRRACGWYANLLAQGLDRVPFFLVFDLGYMLLLGREFPFRALNGDEADHRQDDRATQRRRVGYENRLLNRFLALPVFRELQNILEDGADIDARISAILECWVAPLSAAPLPSLQAATHAIRRLTIPARSDMTKLRDEVEARLEAPGLFAAQCRALVERYEHESLQRLVAPEDLFVFRNIEALGRRAQRLTARKISEIEVAIGPADPPPAHLRYEAPQVSVELDDAGFFPQGGLDQLANRGSIENLVRTELGYIDEDDEIDLFTLRYLEGELLYYTRDEGQLMRRTRTVHIALSLTSAHHILYPGHPARLSILLQGLIGRLIEDLFELFESDALQIDLRVSGDRAGEACELWAIRFKEAIERGELKLRHDREALALDASLPGRLLEAGRLATFICAGANHALSDERREQWSRDGLPAFVVECPAHPRDEEVVTSTWRFPVYLEQEGSMIERLRGIRRALVWRLFGC